MTVEICHGCGRRASGEEVHCAACGRPLLEGDVSPPPGWMTAAVGREEPPVRPDPGLTPGGDLEPQDASQLFIPAGARRPPAAADAWVAIVAAEVPAASAAGQPVHGNGAPRGAGGDPGGGHGWRVRVTAAQADSVAAAAAADAPRRHVVAAAQAAARRLPFWVLPVLITAILATSAAAVLIIVVHAIHAS